MVKSSTLTSTKSLFIFHYRIYVGDNFSLESLNTRNLINTILSVSDHHLEVFFQVNVFYVKYLTTLCTIKASYSFEVVYCSMFSDFEKIIYFI
jgi:hypothetical protein